MRDNAGEARTNSSGIFYYGPFPMYLPVFADQQEITYKSSVLTKKYMLEDLGKRWRIATDGKIFREIPARSVTFQTKNNCVIYIYIYTHTHTRIIKKVSRLFSCGHFY